MDKQLYVLLEDSNGKILKADLKASLIGLLDYSLDNMADANGDALSSIARLRAQVAILLSAL